MHYALLGYDLNIVIGTAQNQVLINQWSDL